METNTVRTIQPKPKLSDYIEYRSYLGDIWQWTKNNEGISYAQFSARAGFRSRSFLRLVIAGKRQLTLDSIRKISIGFHFSREEAELFETLVLFNQASDLESRQSHWEKYVKRTKDRRPAMNVIHDSYSYMARFSIPVLHALLGNTDISHESEDLAKMLGVSVSQAEDSLQTLQRMGLIHKQNEKWQKVYESSITTDHVPSVAIQTFHNNMLERAQKSLELPVAERNFQTLMTALNQEQYLALTERIKLFLDEIQSQELKPSATGQERLYAININSIPISTDFIRPEACQKSEIETKEGDL